MIAGLVQGSDRSSTKAYLRSITNVGMTIGAGIAALALHADTKGAYLTVLYVDVATYALTAVLVAGLPHIRPTPRGEALRMTAALRDLPFVAVVVGRARCSPCTTGSSRSPCRCGWSATPRRPGRWWRCCSSSTPWSWCVAQVAVARRVATVAAAVRATVVSGVLFLVACAVFGTTDGMSAGTGRRCVLVLASLVAVAGELAQASASFLLGLRAAARPRDGPVPGRLGPRRSPWRRSSRPP